jgi:hypothetical protein
MSEEQATRLRDAARREQAAREHLIARHPKEQRVARAEEYVSATDELDSLLSDAIIERLKA